MNSSQLIIPSAANAANSAIHLSQWFSHQLEWSLHGNLRTILACVLSFVSAAVSSAGGVGGGSLYVPILNIVARLDLKTSTAFSTFMVTGGTLSNVLYTVFARGTGARTDGQPLINYDIAVVSQPCLLLGVSIGVVCNVMFPEWLITALFSLFLAFATFKTYGSGVKRWRAETAVISTGTEAADGRPGTEEPLLGRSSGSGSQCRWVDLGVLVTIWFCFFVMHLLIGGEGAKGAFEMIKPCGTAYWLITVAQIPVTVAFTACIGHQKRKFQAQDGLNLDQTISAKSKLDILPAYVFPVAALLTGVMGGLFGIGGGLLLNPVLLHIGVPPKTVSATTMFMVLFCASMSMVQFIILGVQGILTALIYAVTCFVASILGLVAIEGAIRRSGRSSLIVFVVAAILALSAVVIACSGAVRVWAQYMSGQYMGFKMPC